jgi:hypothetical protein
MAEEPLVFISDKLSSDIGHLQTKPRHREGYGVWVTQNSLAKWKKRPLNFQEFEYRRSGGDTTLVLCQHRSQGIPRACSSRRRRGSPVYLGRAVPPSPQTRAEIAVLGCLGLFRTTSGTSILRGRSAHRHGALYVTVCSTQGHW